LLESARTLEALAEDDIQSVQKKAEVYRKLYAGADRHRLEAACDLYIAAFLTPKTEPPVRTVGGAGAFIPTSRDVWDKIEGKRPLGLVEVNATAATKAARVFHWPLEFPQVFFNGGERKPGFDLSLGNPPWERIKLQEQEFFATRDTAISNAPSAAARRARIEALKNASIGSVERALYEEFSIAKRTAEASSIFARINQEEGGRFPLSGTGDVNTYALFAELFTRLVSIQGRSGCVLPTGIATDASTSDFFGHLVSAKKISALYDFENREHLFDGLHTKTKFCLLATTAQPSEKMRLCFMATKISDISDARKVIEMDAEHFSQFNPNTNTSPIFRSAHDARLTSSIYSRTPVLMRRQPAVENPWDISFGSLFHMSNDSNCFADEEAPGHVRLYEAKMFWHFDHRWASFSGEDARLVSSDLKKNPNFISSTRYWVSSAEANARLSNQGWDKGWLLAFRNISDSRNERTFVSTVVPACALGNSASIVLPSQTDTKLIACLMANFNSIVLDYVARQKIPGMNVNFFMVEQFPILAPKQYRVSDIDFIVPRVLELTFTASDLTSWAKDLGFNGKPFAFDIDRRCQIRAELDAYFAKLYGLTREELAFILDPAMAMGPEYPSETFRVLIDNETAAFGEYRTGRLVLQAFDQLADGTLSTEVAQPASGTVKEGKSSRLADGAWSRPLAELRGETGAMLVALLKAMETPLPARHVRLAAILALEPRLLHAQLTREQSSKWLHLIGDEAKPLPKGTPQFVPPSDQNWGAVVRGLRTRGALIEDAKAGTWGPGKGLDKIETGGWPDGRAGFVLDIIRASGDQTLLATLPAELKRWLDAEAA
jgi:hypothetical protein